MGRWQMGRDEIVEAPFPLSAVRLLDVDQRCAESIRIVRTRHRAAGQKAAAGAFGRRAVVDGFRCLSAIPFPSSDCHTLGALLLR